MNLIEHSVKFFSNSLLFLMIAFSMELEAQLFYNQSEISPADTLKARNHDYRNWWNVKAYEVNYDFDFDNAYFLHPSSVEIVFIPNGVKQNYVLQLDSEFKIEAKDVKFVSEGKAYKLKDSELSYENGAYLLNLNRFKELINKAVGHSSNIQLEVNFLGALVVAPNAPWNGGWVFKKDRKGRPWITAAVQGKGCSLLFPCKNYLGDEADSVVLHLNKRKGISTVAAGRLIESDKKSDTWAVRSTINNYNIIPYLGSYERFSDSLNGIGGILDLEIVALDYNRSRAQKHFGKQLKPMLKIFESWFGPYPFYEDGYKIIDAPFAGMEHQSAIAYGNDFKDGYAGGDVSGSGWGKKFDYIMVHETAHEWFGNSISVKDLSDLWVHEGFATYAEVLYVESRFGAKAAEEYLLGTRNRISNHATIVVPYGINKEGSPDMYWKGSNMIHTLRQWVADDDLFRETLKKMNKAFYHQTIDGKDVEAFWIKETGLPLQSFFNQYLRNTEIPVLEYDMSHGELWYRWSDVVSGFEMPIKTNAGEWLHPKAEWQSIAWTSKDFSLNQNFYVDLKRVKR